MAIAVDQLYQISRIPADQLRQKPLRIPPRGHRQLDDSHLLAFACLELLKTPYRFSDSFTVAVFQPPVGKGDRLYILIQQAAALARQQHVTYGHQIERDRNTNTETLETRDVIAPCRTCRSHVFVIPFLLVLTQFLQITPHQRRLWGIGI